MNDLPCVHHDSRTAVSSQPSKSIRSFYLISDFAKRVREDIDKLYEEATKGETAEIPEDLQAQVKQAMDADASLSWDAAVWEIVTSTEAS
jgi:hypothetical protein